MISKADKCLHNLYREREDIVESFNYISAIIRDGDKPSAESFTELRESVQLFTNELQKLENLVIQGDEHGLKK